MKQIKTIKNRLDNEKQFDAEVNAALADGWQLTKREVLMPTSQDRVHYTYIMLYAELEREEITEAERCCDNCAHWNKAPDQPPCSECSDQADKWEAVE